MFDAYAEIEGVPGESTAANFEEQIVVLAYSHNVAQQSDVAASGRAATAGRCIHADFSMTKGLDKASPLLDEKCSSGEKIPKVTLTLTRAAGDEQKVFMTYVMTDCVVSNVSISGGSGGGDATQNVSFNYGKIEWTYTEFSRGGGSDSNVAGSWNLQTNTKV